MQRVTVICVGKLKEKFYAEAAAEYAKRLSRYCKLELIELPEQRLPENPSPAEVERALAREAEAIRGKLPPGAWVTALCIEGRTCSSQELAGFLADWGREKRLALSMSPMTFPHHLARVMLLEQIYRGFQINEGGKYHK